MINKLGKSKHRGGHGRLSKQQQRHARQTGRPLPRRKKRAQGRSPKILPEVQRRRSPSVDRIHGRDVSGQADPLGSGRFLSKLDPGRRESLEMAGPPAPRLRFLRFPMPIHPSRSPVRLQHFGRRRRAPRASAAISVKADRNLLKPRAAPEAEMPRANVASELGAVIEHRSLRAPT